MELFFVLHMVNGLLAHNKSLKGIAYWQMVSYP